MKTIWTVICVLAVANLLAIGGVFGWLRATDRMNIDRLRAIQQLLAPTIAQDNKKKAEAAAKIEQEAKDAATATRRAGSPESAASKLQAGSERADIIEQQLVRAKEEIRQLQQQVDSQKRELSERSKQIEEARAAFDAQRKAWEQTSTDEQFQQVVGVLQGQRAADAASVLRQMLKNPDATPADPLQANNPANAQAPVPSDEMAVRYLAAMSDRARNKIIAVYVKEDPALAADLLKRLQSRGELAPASQTASP